MGIDRWGLIDGDALYGFVDRASGNEVVLT